MKQTYPEFLEDTENFIFVESKPEQADIIFVPGNGYPQMAEQAARLYKEGMAAWVLPSGRYSVINQKFSGVLAKGDIYNGTYETEWEFLQGCPDKEWSSKRADPQGRHGNIYL